MIFVPFESVIMAQSDLLKTINQWLPQEFKSSAAPDENASAVMINMSGTSKIRMPKIGTSERASIKAMATKLLGCDDSLGPLLPYLLSDLCSPEVGSTAPMVWDFSEQQ